MAQRTKPGSRYSKYILFARCMERAMKDHPNMFDLYPELKQQTEAAIQDSRSLAKQIVEEKQKAKQKDREKLSQDCMVKLLKMVETKQSKDMIIAECKRWKLILLDKSINGQQITEEEKNTFKFVKKNL